MCVRVCDIEFVVFTDCEGCTNPISTNPGSMEAGEYVLTRGTWVSARSRGGRGRRAAVDSVVCLGGADFFVLSMSLHFLSFVDPEQPASNR